MSYSLTPEQNILFESAYKFGCEEILPISLLCEEQENIPRELLAKLGKLGFGAICVPKSLGGLGEGFLASSLVHEALAMSCPAIAAFVSVHNMATGIIAKYGTTALRSEWLERLVTMASIASYCLTEPHCGSDAVSLTTTAVKEEGGYKTTGTKSFITGGGYSDIYLVMVRTGGKGPLGISALCVEKETNGLRFASPEKKMGWKSHSTSKVLLEDCLIPISNLVGREGHGFRLAMEALNEGRLNIASCSLGGAQAAFNKAVLYMSDRTAFGKKLKDFQALQFKIAEMETELQSSRAMLRLAAKKMDDCTKDATTYCAMAKLMVTERSSRVANDALQILGGYGYLTDYGIEKIVRDLRVHQIVEGSSEVMKEIISSSIFHK
ncbi:acyl-CoA dehydrogenase family protein [Dickeya dianthicola]|uniref:acyl-CoA dehydrogenase family protein n=1 Tax=Dickeya dianthicola TaxID=204039 RepID=UPI001867D5E2|nr:acyl-CoA dehydrogenase family protein [Dickeya dianthicola]QOL13600.1 acyl-CoA dehydrogenase [Dickeya dianthicola]